MRRHDATDTAGAGRRVVESAAAPGGTWPKDLTAVFVHGAMDRGAGMARLTRSLADAPTVRYDRRGYGHALALAPAAFAGQVEDLVEIVRDRPVVLFGHSFGGLVVLAAAAAGALDVRAVSVYEAPTPWTDWWPPWPGPRDGDGIETASEEVAGDTAEAFLRSMIGDDRWDRLPSRTKATRRAEGRALLADVSTETSVAMPFRPEAITVPTVIAYGGASLHQYHRAAELLASSVSSGELHRIDGADHGAPLTKADEVAALIRRAASLASVG